LVISVCARLAVSEDVVSPGLVAGVGRGSVWADDQAVPRLLIAPRLIRCCAPREQHVGRKIRARTLRRIYQPHPPEPSRTGGELQRHRRRKDGAAYELETLLASIAEGKPTRRLTACSCSPPP